LNSKKCQIGCSDIGFRTKVDRESQEEQDQIEGDILILASSLFLISLVGTFEHIPRRAGGWRGRRIPKVNGYPTYARSNSSDLHRPGRNIQGRRG
jgi:hypothetical protein